MPQNLEKVQTPIRYRFDHTIAQAVADEQWKVKREGKSITPLEAMNALRERGELPGVNDKSEPPAEYSADDQQRFDDFLTAVLRFHFGCGKFEHLSISERLDLYCLLEDPIQYAEWVAVRYPNTR